MPASPAFSSLEERSPPRSLDGIVNILDTNVLSALMRTSPDVTVVSGWTGRPPTRSGLRPVDNKSLAPDS